MFLLPPGEASRKYFEPRDGRTHYMVGVFGDSKAAMAQQARFTNGGMASAGHINNNMNK